MSVVEAPGPAASVRSARDLTPTLGSDTVVEAALATIAARALTLPQRLQLPLPDPAADRSGALVEQRLVAWQAAAGAGDPEVFGRRLAWDGLDLDAARRALVPSEQWTNAVHPAWLSTLREALELSARPSRDHLAADAAPVSGPLPFQDVLVPFVELATRRVVEWATRGWDRLTETAHATLRHTLLQTLCVYSAQTLQLEFSLWRRQRQSGLGRLLAAALEQDDSSLYREFTDGLRSGGLLGFFTEYSVLARLLSTITDLWADATTEFLLRLEADWTTLQDIFGGGRTLGQVAAVSASLSDPHRGRRSVIALTFESGLRVMYKPKDLGVDVAYNRLLSWIDGRSGPVSFRQLTTIARPGYGWVEHVSHTPGQDPTQIHDYYYNSGALLCLLHVLGATDCHFENIIAAGADPVAIDLETLLHHYAAEDRVAGTVAEQQAEQQLARSALATGLLPVWQLGDDGSTVYDVSGLGGVDEQLTQFETGVWSHVNTNEMTLRFEPATVRPQTNVPVLTGGARGLAEHRQQIVDGFTDQYRFLVANRDALLAPESPLVDFGAQNVRVLLRNTSLYGRLHQQLMSPRYLREGVDRSIKLELLCRLFLDRSERPRLWPVVDAEQLAMERPDIPFLAARADSDGLTLETGEVVDGCFEEPSWQALQTRVATTLGEDDLAAQLAFVEGSLFSHSARDTAATPAVADIASQSSPAPTPAPEDLVTHAVDLAGELARRAVRGSDGSAAWIAPQYLVKVGRYQFQAVGYDLYGGGAGIALALAAVADVTGNPESRALALAALQPVRVKLSADPSGLARSIGIGGAAGLGGLVYSLVRVGDLLGGGSLTDDAVRVAELITDELITADAALDVVSGAAGAVLGLLALDAVRPGSDALHRAIRCGEHLLRRRTVTGTGHRSWQTADRFLTGFSHGAAGIAYALLRLSTRSDQTRFAEAAADAIGYERTTFVPELDNWRDLRSQAADGPTCSTRWCHGAPGIALARLGGLPALDTAEVRFDIAAGLSATREFGLERLDHLCCGNLGRADVLLAAGSLLGQPELTALARSRAGEVVARAHEAGTFLLHPLSSRVYAPGLFQGTAGVVYSLLRMAEPDRLASVLLWQ